ncbi:hypothetical protein [Mediterraneibacter agrestimuris]|uniref:hypothetical protein n=1 Tax=Mediterraneibacter agrestimuris TaxID=2941333 RepID=UPI00203E1317|nr:hypothetical protein [Mediterraneibacter agrestimuris]
MEKMILNDNTEISIKEGAGLNSITAVASGWKALGGIADALLAAGNLDKVNFSSDGDVTGEYENMKLEFPLFQAVDIASDGKIHATFAIRQKTEMELAIEELQRQQEGLQQQQTETNSGQSVQDGAIMELAGMIGGE